MPMYLPEKGPRIFFAHVPKAAGSSVKTYLAQRFGRPIMNDTTVYLGDARYRRRGFVTPPSHFSAADLDEFLPESLDLCFSFVREPLARAVSEYRYQKGVSRLARLSFSTWLRTALAAAARDPRVYQNHLRPQTEMVPERAEVFRLEDGFDAFVARLDEVAGQTAPMTIDHVNRSKASTDEVTIHRQDADLVARFYAEDYRRFGYDLPSLDAFPVDPRAGVRDLYGRLVAPVLVAAQRRKWLR